VVHTRSDSRAPTCRKTGREAERRPAWRRQPSAKTRREPGGARAAEAVMALTRGSGRAGAARAGALVAQKP
jgi:hypothetical protein